MNAVTENSHERFLRTLHKAVYIFDRQADRLLADAGIGTFSQFLILMATVQCPGLSQQRIAEFLDLTPAAVSRQIDSLVSAGMIDRKLDPANRRSHTINLTKKGEEKFKAMHYLLLSSFEKSLVATPKELDAASDVVEKVLSSISPEYADAMKKRSRY